MVKGTLRVKSNQSSLVEDLFVAADDLGVVEVNGSTLGDTYMTIPANAGKGESTVITEDTEVLGMQGMSKLTIFPQYLDEDVCNKLVHSILNCGNLCQYQRSGIWDEPRLHTLLHP